MDNRKLIGKLLVHAGLLMATGSLYLTYGLAVGMGSLAVHLFGTGAAIQSRRDNQVRQVEDSIDD